MLQFHIFLGSKGGTCESILLYTKEVHIFSHTLKTAVKLSFVIYLSLELSPINVCHYFVINITHVAWLKKFTEGSL